MKTTFTYSPNDSHVTGVKVAGEWNNWAALDMTAVAGVYSLALDLAPGAYAYKFIATKDDGSTNWLLDPYGIVGKYNAGVLNNVVLVQGYKPGAAQNLAGATVLSWGCNYYDTISTGSCAYTFAQLVAQLTPGVSIGLKLSVTGAPCTLTFPPSQRIGGDLAALTSLVLPIGCHELSWVYDGTVYWLADSAP